jgi:hypothetical protein
MGSICLLISAASIGEWFMIDRLGARYSWIRSFLEISRISRKAFYYGGRGRGVADLLPDRVLI